MKERNSNMMITPPFRVRWFGIVLALALIPNGGAAPGPETYVIRIDKTVSEGLPPEVRTEIRVVKDLGDSWLALVGGEGARRLEESAALYEILDETPMGKAYFLVRLGRGIGWQDAARYGSARPLNARTALFWTNGVEAREILPPRWAIARLDFDAARPLDGGSPVSSQSLRVPPAAQAYDPFIAELVAQVSKSRLTAAIGDLQNFRTRYASTASCEAAGTYLFDAFARSGLSVEYDPFTFSRGRYASRNIVATLPGQTSPQKIVIVCAHYDSTSDREATLAPGADDNGSGSAAVVELAGVLAGRAFDYTIRLICFSAEEWGFYGSLHYAQEAKAQGENVIAVINLDMIGIPDPYPDRMDVVVNSASQWLYDSFAHSASTYASLRTRKVLDNSWDYSDQSPFWDNGYSALCGIENEDPSSPYYHTTNDVLATLNMDYATSITRAALAAASELARPVSTPRSPTGLLARSQILGSLYAGSKTVFLRWNPNADSIAGYNVYRSRISGGPYEKINAELAPIAEYKDRRLDPRITYFYTVTSVDGSGRESRASSEAADSPQAWVN
jgi:hypothetical protein